MSAIVIEHVNVADLPEMWRAKLPLAGAEHVTVRIETEEVTAAPDATGFVTNDPAFGIWRDREDMTDVEDYLRKVRDDAVARSGFGGCVDRGNCPGARHAAAHGKRQAFQPDRRFDCDEI